MSETMEGKTLGGRYRLERQTGGGGMSNVYQAADLRIPRNVAVKVFRFGTSKNWKREIQAIAGLDHRNIVKIYDADHDDAEGVDFIAMQWLPGGALDVSKSRPLTEVVSIIKQLAEALQYAHDKGIIHRDVKHGNVMIGEQGQPVLIDFSIAMGEGIDATRTNINASIGTFTHMSPEQAQGETLTPATDQYSLGVIAYNLVTGELPFKPPAPTPMAFMYMHITAQPPVPWNVPESVSRVLLKSLAKKPEERYPTVTEFANALESAVLDPTRGVSAPIPVGTPPGGVAALEQPTDRGFEAIRPELYTAPTVPPITTVPPAPTPLPQNIQADTVPPVQTTPPPPQQRRIPPILIGLGVVGIAVVALAIGVLIAIIASGGNPPAPTGVAQTTPSLPANVAALATSGAQTLTAVAANGTIIPNATDIVLTATAIAGTGLPPGVNGTLTAVAGSTTILIPNGTEIAQTATAIAGTGLPPGVNETLTAVANGKNGTIPNGTEIAQTATAFAGTGLPPGVNGTLTAVAGATTIVVPNATEIAQTATAFAGTGLPPGVNETLTAVAGTTTVAVPNATEIAQTATAFAGTALPPGVNETLTAVATMSTVTVPTTPAISTEVVPTAVTPTVSADSNETLTAVPTLTTAPITETPTAAPASTEPATRTAGDVASPTPSTEAPTSTTAATQEATVEITNTPAQPTADLTLEAQIQQTISAIQTMTETARPTNTPVLTSTPTLTDTPKATDTRTPTNTATLTNTPAATNTVTPTRTPTRTPTVTSSPTRAGTPIGGGSGKLVFKSNRDGVPNIYEIDADGTNAIALTPQGVDNGDPAPSPDGKTIAYVSKRTGKAQIYSIQIGSKDEKQLTGSKDTEGENYSPVFSKDGKSIFFVSTRNSTATRANFEIYSMDADGKNPKRLSNNPAFDAEISMMPDGKKFMFNSDRAGWLQIYTANLDGTSPQRILGGTINDAFPDISPDGKVVVFLSDRSSTPGTADNRQIYTVNVNGSGLKKFPITIKNPNPTIRPRWSPDGKLIAYASTLPNGNWAIFVVDADGKTEPRQITDGQFSEGDGGVRWLP